MVDAFGGRTDIQIVTTSDAPSVAWDFPVYKMPSKSTVRRHGGPVEDYARIARLTLIQLAASFRPDLLVLDTVPEGAFHELLVLRDHAVSTAFVDRRRDANKAHSEVHQSHLALYDLVLVPDHAHRARHYPMDLKRQSRRRFVGPIHGWQAHRALSREAARRLLAVPDDRLLVYVSAGGGGDSQAQAQMEAVVQTLSEDGRFFLLLGYGPLYRGPLLYGPHRIPFTGGEVNRYFLGVDLAVSAAGYNSYQELLAARVPTAFFAQQKGIDRQDERIAEGLEAGFHLELTDFEPATIRRTVDRLTDRGCVAELRSNLASRPVADGALKAAAELLRVATENGRGAIERAELPLAEQLLGFWPDVVGSDVVAQDPADPPSFVHACRLLLGASDLAGRTDRLCDLALVARETDGPSPEWTAQARELLAWGLRMARFFDQLDLSEADARRWLRLVFSGVDSDHAWHAGLQVSEDFSRDGFSCIDTLREDPSGRTGSPVDPVLGRLMGALGRTLNRRDARSSLQAVLDVLSEGQVTVTDLASALDDVDGSLSFDDLQDLFGSTARFHGDPPL